MNQILKCRLGFHDWEKWERYKWEGSSIITINFINKLVEYTETRQKRKCLACCYSQDKKIKNG